jgi:undecaprenyl diphosphate synthase
MINTKKIPFHLGIILDGNRRWAKEKGLPAFEGHRRGMETAKKIIKYAENRGINVLTLFVFSNENWKRSKNEVNYLMKLLGQALDKKNIEEFHKQGIKVRVIGQREKLPLTLQKKIKETEEFTKNNKGMVLNFALSYGGRAEIVEAIKKIIKSKIQPDKINEDMISQNLWTSDLDLIIRTGKEQRISNFLIWQAAYSELYFCDKYWPDFSEKDLDEAIIDYGQRQRRFGA